MGPSMNRNLWVLGLLSIVGVSLSVSDASAFLLRHRLFHHRHMTHITCRPYNAFTPICWGNLVCDGCTPSPCAVAGGQIPMGCGPMGCSPWNNMGSVQQFMPSECGTTLPDTTGMVYPGQTMPMYTPAQQQYASYYYPTPYPVQNVGYQGYYPGYNYPVGYNYPANYNYGYNQNAWQPNPYYWYNTGR